MQYCNNKKLLYTLAKPIMSLLLLHKYFQRIARKINKIHAKVLPVLVRNYILTATITTSLQANDSWYMIILTLNCCLCLHAACSTGKMPFPQINQYLCAYLFFKIACQCSSGS